MGLEVSLRSVFFRRRRILKSIGYLLFIDCFLGGAASRRSFCFLVFSKGFFFLGFFSNSIVIRKELFIGWELFGFERRI